MRHFVHFVWCEYDVAMSRLTVFVLCVWFMDAYGSFQASFAFETPNDKYA